MKRAHLALAALLCSHALAPSVGAAEAHYLSTPRVAKIYAPDLGEDKAFFDLKDQGDYCYIEENPERAAYLLLDKMAAGASSLDESALKIEPTKCYDAFLAEAANKKYHDEEIDAQVFKTDVTYAEFRLSALRYLAACMWEQDHDHLKADVAEVKDVDQIWDYFKSGYQPGEYDQVGYRCMPGFLDFIDNDKLFKYHLFQQVLLRRELD